MATGRKTVGVTPAGDGIEVQFLYRGQRLRPRLRLPATKANLMHAHKLRQTILTEIAEGRFDMLAHFPDYKFAKALTTEPVATDRTFGEWADAWLALSKRNLEKSTLQVYTKHLNAYWLPAFRSLKPERITNEAVLLRMAEFLVEHQDAYHGKTMPPISRKTQNNILIPLRGVFAMACRAVEGLKDPTAGIENLKTQAPPPDPFSAEELAAALAQANSTLGAEYADYFAFAAYAGLRTSEQIALQWSAIDLHAGHAYIDRAKVSTETKERTKTGIARTVELNDNALAVLQRQRARTQMAGAEVFVNPTTGKPWANEQAQQRAWMRVLKLCGIRQRPPKELRDTSVSLALQAGADPWYVATQHGHSLQVMLKNYAKWIPNADRGRNRDRINQAASDLLKVPDGLSVAVHLLKKSQ